VELAELSAVSFRYQGSADYALRDITFTLKEGEYVLLTGPSGCGKSTLCRILNGLIPHFYRGELRGEARVAGYDVRSTPTYVLARHVGMVFQNPENQLFLSSVERELAFGLENLGVSESEIERRVKWALEFFNLVELKDRPPYMLSGGQQQKVAIASVVVMEPEILVLDEPTANLDPVSAEEILSLLDTLRKEKNIGILLVEHRLEIALKCADKLVIMQDGRIVEEGDPRSVLLSKHTSIIGVPPVVEAHKVLSGKGIDLGAIPLTPHELASAIERVMRRERGSG